MTEAEPQWIEVRVLCPAEWSELVAEHVADVTEGSVAFGRSSRAADPVPEGAELVRGFYPAGRDSSELRERLDKQLGCLAESTEDERLSGLELLFKPLPPEDWANSWRKSWKPFRAGRLAVVTYDWKGELRDRDVPLRLEPAGAFGTGRHPTTRHLLAWLSHQDLVGKRVLDAGCGSGILSVAACKLGAESAFGFDIDERSVPEGTSLARRNGVEQGTRFLHGGFECLLGVDCAYDIVLANIYADVLTEHAGQLRTALKPDGVAAFSGIHERHLDGVVETLNTGGFSLCAHRTTGRWNSLFARRAT